MNEKNGWIVIDNSGYFCIYFCVNQNEGKSESPTQPLVGQILDILRTKTIMVKDLT